MNDVKVCPGTLAEGHKTYSPVALKYLFGGKKVSHILPYAPPGKDEQATEEFIENRKRLSISGVQEKLSFVLDGEVLRLTDPEGQGQYILKPIPRDLKKVDQVPANEHLTMQIAKQVYGLNVADNALVFFKDGTPAYLTRRFDVKTDGKKWGMEDFASLAGKTVDSSGANFKYDLSYEELASLIRKAIPAWRIEIEKYFQLVIFNYLFSNGDAHMKNFSILETSRGDYLLSPAYDLINTRMHVADTDFALTKGLFADDFRSRDFQRTNHPSHLDFHEFGKRIGVTRSRITALLEPFVTKQPSVTNFMERSFLDASARRGYLIHYNTRIGYLKGK